MTDIFLYAGDATPNNVVMSDPTVQRGGTAVNYTLSLAVGSYTYTGIAATLSLARNLALPKGVYAYNGIAANLTVARNLPLAKGVYVYNGQSANLTVSKNIALSAGVYAYAGLPATLTYVPGTPPVNYTLLLASGVYAYQGSNATLNYQQGVVNYDTHDGGDEKKRIERFKKQKEELRSQIEQALDDATGIEIPDQVEEVKQAIPIALTKEQIAEVTNEVNLLVTQIYMRIALEKAARQDEDDVETLMLLNG